MPGRAIWVFPFAQAIIIHGGASLAAKGSASDRKIRGKSATACISFRAMELSVRRWGIEASRAAMRLW